MAAEHRNATVAAVRTAGRQTADIRRDLTAAPAHRDRVAVAVIEAAVLPIVGLAAAGDIAAAAAALPIVDPAAVAVGDIAAAGAAVRAEEAAVRMRPRHTVAAEGLTGKVVRASPSLALNPFDPGLCVRCLGNEKSSQFSAIC